MGAPERGYIRIDASTAVFAVIGHPVAHSLGPLMHNRAFAETGYPGVYVAFDAADPAGAASAVRALGIRGASVTIPHKVAVMDHLDEIDDEARAIGAVNTIVNKEGRLIGSNTDGLGALRAIEEATPVSGKRVLVIGAGGAARAVGHALAARGARIHIANRTHEKARRLAGDLGAEAVGLGEIFGRHFDILVNTTPAGMHPDTGTMPVPESVLQPGMYIMDIVYNPVRTMLLDKAEKMGCRAIDGVGMFVHQGAAQFSLWTKMQAPVAQMRQAVYDHLNSLDT